MIRYLFLSLCLLVASACPASAEDATLASLAEQQNWARLRMLLDSGNVDIDATQADGMTALHWAASHDRADVARKLLDHGAKADVENRYGIRPLMLACENGNGELVELLLANEAAANVAQPGGETSLMTASRTGSVRAVKALLTHKADINAKQRAGQTAIMWAAAEGHADVVSLLIEHGAEFRTPLRSGFTPLFFAAREGRTSVVDVLLKAGEDVNTVMRPQSEGGRTPRSGTSSLLLAVENGHFELAVHLLEAGADSNDQRSGFTPLHVLTWVRKPNSGDGLDGDPPPIGSGKLTSLQCVRELAKHGADVNSQLERGSSGRGRLSRKGATPFLLAADTADVPLMKQLLELGADPTIPNADKCPPLLAAAGIGTLAPGEEAGTEDEAIAAVKLLLETGADINAVDRNGETAMHGAAYKNLPKMVRFLAANGADIKVWNQKNRYGWTPHLIAEGHRPGNFKPAAATLAEIRAVMQEAGADLPAFTPGKRVNDNYTSAARKPPAKAATAKPPGQDN
jgi:ankyrin repeat protein